ncbi:Lrp/AsnC family transcriptional regulator [Actinoplanes bogorensis]|uniref:Lrp/AsnC family transcriptional regulator n=1 Tax=Paractinoplanes bogorensis TaxID=1610840 RepID=A0ABS5YJY9_9ACTN|nr:Lrp/AsnC family transcriptional regulator [Actinoplanes bogorensis]MBU2663727.1 Lrp/AsnC family transcriptional regulator [Actinoplanes bogorensis]
MDSIDRQILNQLTVNARTSLTDIARTVALSIPAVKRRIDRLERDGVIRGYTTIVEEPGTRKLHAIVELFCTARTERDDVIRVFEGRPEVLIAFSAAGDSDVVMLVQTDGTDHLESFLIDLRRNPHVAQTRSRVMLNTLMGRIPLGQS